jgi:lipopolysaccharide/colanic/teichoic acid biosynthesis glycosyltransferase
VAVKWPLQEVPSAIDCIDSSARDQRVKDCTTRCEPGSSEISEWHRFFSPELNPSPWSVSRAKRWFDVLAVIVALPVLVPVLLLVALAVGLSSEGPVLFVQTRVGQYGRRFKILKFRTMPHDPDGTRPLFTTIGNQRFTPVGRFLRRLKFDELPQVINVLRGDMSLVGPRPKVPDHESDSPACRPGITGAATLVFAREEVFLDGLSEYALDHFVQQVILPAKKRIDSGYMSRATFRSDIGILLKTALRRWNYSTDQSCEALAEVISRAADCSAIQRLDAAAVETAPVTD